MTLVGYDLKEMAGSVALFAMFLELAVLAAFVQFRRHNGNLFERRRVVIWAALLLFIGTAGVIFAPTLVAASRP